MALGCRAYTLFLARKFGFVCIDYRVWMVMREQAQPYLLAEIPNFLSYTVFTRSHSFIWIFNICITNYENSGFAHNKISPILAHKMYPEPRLPIFK